MTATTSPRLISPVIPLRTLREPKFFSMFSKTIAGLEFSIQGVICTTVDSNEPQRRRGASAHVVGFPDRGDWRDTE